MKVTMPSSHPVIRFAANEAQKYLEKMCASEAQSASLRLGLAADLGLEDRFTARHPWDDEIHISVKDGQGTIAGANPRSVLLAVYRFLHEAGCRWVRPGADGEFVPRRGLAGLDVDLHETASFRHRTICIEGANSLENVLDIIDWAPKVGFSGYFMQFREGYTFFDKWYSHRNNPLKLPEPFSLDKARKHTRRVEAELQKRGMLYHAVGHGWTCEALGIPGLGWDADPRDYPPEITELLAEVDGKRSMRWDIPMLTSLCFSNPKARKLVVDEVVRYALAHPEIDLLHFWLDDGNNNKCECERCRRKRPADFYVEMLNDVDSALAAQDNTQQIVFLAYVDMLWPPHTARIHNPERFVFMFAPMDRSYNETLASKRTLPALPPFVLNRLKFPSGVQENLAFAHAWREKFDGDSFVFDYYFTIGSLYNYDPGHLQIARSIYDDIRSNHANGFNGLVSCQLQRAFFPGGLGVYLMGRTLWDESLDFEALVEEYFFASLGKDGRRAREFLEELGRLLDWPRLGEITPGKGPSRADLPRKVSEMLRRFQPVIERNLSLADACQARSWEYLRWYAQIVPGLARVIAARWAGNQTEAAREWARLKQFVQEQEDTLQPALDVYSFVEAHEKILFPKKTG